MLPDDTAAAALLQIAALTERVTVLEDALVREPDIAGYAPVPAPRWWLLDSEDRDAATDRLAAWVEQVYLPSYGHLARRLPPCWREHPLCLHVLDWLSELWSVLYIRDRRSAPTLAGQAGFHVRQLPAAADLMAAEVKTCEHARPPRTGGAR